MFELQLEQNIRKTVVNAKRHGTVGMSLECLFQNTPTPKVSPEVGLTQIQYKNLFAKIANKVAKSFILE